MESNIEDNGLTTVRTYGGRLINRAEPLITDDPIFPHVGGTVQPQDWPLYPVTDSTDVDPGLIYYPDSLVNQPNPWEQALTDYYYVQDGLGTRSATYDSRGYLTSLGMYRGQATLRQMTFNFEDGTGNLLSRTGMGSQMEEFTYDNLDRLTNVSGSNYHSFTYDLNGNLDYKSGAGYLSYSATHLHAVVGATNEGAVSSTPQTITYSPFGKILSIIEGNYSMDFTYGPDEERWKTVLWQGNSVLRTTIYGDNYEQVIDAYGQTRHIYYLDGAVYILEDGATSGNLYFAFTDHLGSITRLYNESGSLVFDAEYDAWGQQTVNTNTVDFRRGYTGHEMMPEFNLINMNGRLYDPALGRFLSPDNYVQLPDFSQSFNRYSYCLNNPLKYTDPNGELFGIDDVLIIAAMAYIGGIQANMSHSMNNGTNPFNPLAWNWKSFSTYLGVAGGGLNGAGIAGLNVFSLTVPGIFTNGVLHATGNVLLNGITNWTEGNNFFKNWGWSALAGFIEGAIGGYAEAKEQGRNIWDGTKEIKREIHSQNIIHGVAKQEDSSQGCYAVSGEYAEKVLNGGYDRNDYYNAANKSPGANFSNTARKLGRGSGELNKKDYISFANAFDNNRMTGILTIGNNPLYGHTVNVTSFELVYKTKLLGKGTRILIKNIKIWDPINASVRKLNENILSFSWFRLK